MGGGAPRAPPGRYRSVVSTWLEIMSSPLVTFILKTLPKHGATQFWNFLPKNLKNLRSKTTGQYGFWRKKFKRVWFCLIFSNKLLGWKLHKPISPVASLSYMNSTFQCRSTINDIQQLVSTYNSYFVTILHSFLIYCL